MPGIRRRRRRWSLATRRRLRKQRTMPAHRPLRWERFEAWCLVPRREGLGLFRPPGAPVDLDVRAPVARRQVLEHRERDLWSMCAVDAVIDACREGSTSSSLAGCGLPRRQGQRKADHCWSASCEHCLLCCCCWWSSTIANHAKRQRLSELWLLLLQRPRGAFCV